MKKFISCLLIAVLLMTAMTAITAFAEEGEQAESVVETVGATAPENESAAEPAESKPAEESKSDLLNSAAEPVDHGGQTFTTVLTVVFVLIALAIGAVVILKVKKSKG